ncbi:hypothetical protein [Candidatus Albibeggiatoa sp. nov. BB20]|uniref:hypothetical protein n=1 Tax=Candidatus Albibeggiatoa sp. nov. BB20 TaxID=3162723 RepID=UPI003365833D
MNITHQLDNQLLDALLRISKQEQKSLSNLIAQVLQDFVEHNQTQPTPTCMQPEHIVQRNGRVQ